MARALPRESEVEGFGPRLRRLRAARALTQTELGRRVELSQRMIAYYEVQGGTPSAPLVAKLAKALRVPVDELLGVKAAHKPANDAPRSPTELRLWRKFRQIQRLPERRRRSILDVLDGLLAGVHEPDDRAAS